MGSHGPSYRDGDGNHFTTISYLTTYMLCFVGYKELFDYLEGKISLSTAVELIKQHTRNFAKRQLTWFKRDPEIHWFQPSQLKDIIQLIEQQTGITT